MLVRVVLESLWRGRRRTALAAFALFLASTAWTLVLAIGAGLGDRTRRDLTTYGANIVVRPETADSAPSILGAPLPAPPSPQTIPEASLSALASIFWKNNITAVSPALDIDGFVDGRPAGIEGVEFRDARAHAESEKARTGIVPAHPAWRIESGRWPSEAESEAAVGDRLARSRGISPGDRVSLRGKFGERSATISGIFRSGEREDDRVLIPLAMAQELSGSPGRVSRVDISALTTPDSKVLAPGRDPKTLPPEEYDRWYCTPFASSIAFQITEAIPGSRATPIRRVTQAEERSATISRTLLLFSGGAAVVGAFFAVFAALQDSVERRVPEIGLWRSLGASPERVAAVFLAEALLSGLIGGVAGAGAGLMASPIAARALFGFTISPSPAIAAVSIAASLAVSAAACVRPIDRTIRTPAIAALRQA
jgi:putative ABC transport system permease protein